MTQDTRKGGSGSTTKKRDGSNGSMSDQTQRNKDKRERDIPSSKVVIRRLPPSMTMEVFMDQISPVPDNDYMYFVRADMSLGQYAFSRAYINFVNQDDIFLFKDKFDGYVFVDRKGNEFPAIVEFAPFQKIPKKKIKKKDAKCGTIEQDADYLLFLESLNNPEEVSLPNAEFHLEEIESRERELRANNGVPLMTTPLIEYIKQKKADKLRMREEKRDERKRRELEKKRVKEEERRRRKADKERDRNKESKGGGATGSGGGGGRDREAIRLAGHDDRAKANSNQQVKLLKNPDRENNRPKDITERDSASLVDNPSHHNEPRTTDLHQHHELPHNAVGGAALATSSSSQQPPHSSSTANDSRAERFRGGSGRDGEPRPARFAATGPPGVGAAITAASGSSAAVTSGNREKERGDWEAERRRRQEEEKQRYRDKQRERRERERGRFNKKGGRDETHPIGQVTPAISNESASTSGATNMAPPPPPIPSNKMPAFKSGRTTKPTSGSSGGEGGTMNTFENRPANTSRSTEWHATGRNNASRVEGATGGGQFGSRGGGRGGGGKSYEKSRESMAKARGGVTVSGNVGIRKPDTGGTQGGGPKPVVSSATPSTDVVADKAASPPVDAVLEVENDGVENGVKSRSTTDVSESADAGHQPRNRRERDNRREPPRAERNERRIRNKDRPSIELYRPGMSRRLSLQPQKDSASSSSSPTPASSPTAHLLGRQTRDGPVDSTLVGESGGGGGHGDDHERTETNSGVAAHGDDRGNEHSHHARHSQETEGIQAAFTGSRNHET